MRYQRKPGPLVEAQQWTDPAAPPAGVRDVEPNGGQPRGLVDTIGGPARVHLNDWVLPDRDPGTCYPVRPDVFADIYEPAEG
jgi:hypothetical protein